MHYKRGMNDTKYYYIIKRTLVLVYVCAALSAQGAAQDNRKHASSPPLMGNLFLFDHANEGDTDAEVDTDDVADEASEDSVFSEQKKPPTHKHASERGFCFQFRHDMRKGAGIAAGVHGRGYEGFLNLDSPMPMPYFELSVKNFALGLYPLAALQDHRPQKNIPTVFLGAGCLTFDAFLKKALCTGFSKIKANYNGIVFPREQFIGLGSAQRTIHYGIEIHDSSWNGAFFASPEPTKQRMRYGLMGAWRITQGKKTDMSLAIQHITAFIPALAQGKMSFTAPLKKGKDTVLHYHKLFGLSAILTRRALSLETTGFLSYTADHLIAGSMQAECDIHARVTGVHTGASYRGTGTVNWDGKPQKELISTFIQPYLKTHVFSCSALYGFSMDQRMPFHRGAVAMKIKYGVIRWQIGWDYRTMLHTLKTDVTCTSNPLWFTSVQWFKKARVGSSFVLQDKSINPLMLKKYDVYADSTFCLVDGIFCRIAGSLSQSTHRKENKKEQIFCLQDPMYRGSIALTIKRDGIDKVHTGMMKVSVKNEKPYFNITLGYEVCQ